LAVQALQVLTETLANAVNQVLLATLEIKD
jgi:hypothetical protein